MTISHDDDPFHILGIETTAGDDEVRQAYLTLVKQYPPDRDPDGFPRLRAAYELLKNADHRLDWRLGLRSRSKEEPKAVLETLTTMRTPVGPEPWLRLAAAAPRRKPHRWPERTDAMTLTPERRTQILETLADWLDRGCAAEELPEGFPETEVAAAAEPDLLSIVTALSRLSEDVRLQGKHFRRLQEILEEQRVQSAFDAQQTSSAPGLASSVVSVSELIETVRNEERNEWLLTLIDLHDRLCRTLEEAERQLRKAGRWRRVLGAVPVEKALVEGLRLTVKRFDELLAAHQTVRFGRVGDRFDPETMKAVDVIEPSNAAFIGSGMVSVVISAGYRYGAKLLRCVNVQVGK